MDRLKTLLQANIAKIESNIATNNVPTEEQLEQFLTTLCAHVGNALGLSNPQAKHAPAGVVKICRGAFAGLYWDPRRNRSIARGSALAARTPQRVLSVLQETLTRLEAWRPPVEPTAEELEDFNTKGAQKLWELDVNRLRPGTDYQLDLQRYTRPGDHSDHCGRPLFAYVDEAALQRPTYATFIALLDNYVAETGVSEVVTQEERNEETAFMNAIMDTPVMQYAYAYCHRRGALHGQDDSLDGFKRLVHQLWFGLYRREAANDSSAFEHTFVGESKQNSVIGLHNWIRIALLERAGELDYHGYVRPRRAGRNGGYGETHADEQLISMQFAWDDEVKPVSSSFVGVSPEFELALYTVCFLCGEEKSVVEVGQYHAEITVYELRQRGHRYIGTAFPAAAPLNEHQAAAVIQSNYRGHNTRGKGAQRASAERHERESRHHAATQVQRHWRGHHGRRTT